MSKTKKLSIIMSLCMICILCIGGVFYLFLKPKEEKQTVPSNVLDIDDYTKYDEDTMQEIFHKSTYTDIEEYILSLSEEELSDLKQRNPFLTDKNSCFSQKIFWENEQNFEQNNLLNPNFIFG